MIDILAILSTKVSQIYIKVRIGIKSVLQYFRFVSSLVVEIDKSVEVVTI